MNYMPPDAAPPDAPEMNGAGGPVPPDPAQDPNQPPAGPESADAQPAGGFVDTVAELAGASRVLAMAARASAGDLQNPGDPEAADRFSDAALKLAQAAAALDPPVKPIDPNLHADFRSVDPQRQVELAHEAEQKRLDREHQLALERVRAQAQKEKQVRISRDSGGNLTGTVREG